MNVSELRLGGLIFDHHHVSCFRRDELQDGEGGGRFLYFCRKRKRFASLNRAQNLATMTAARVKLHNSPELLPLLGWGSASQHPAYF